MNREKKFIKNILIYSIGDFGSKILGFLLLPFYTFYLSVNDYGYFDLITTSFMLLSPLITLQITDGLYRHLLEATDKAQKDAVISRSLGIIIRNLIVFNLICIFVFIFTNFKFQYLILTQLNLAVISSAWMQISRGLKRNLEFSIAGMITTGLTLICNIILIGLFTLRVDGLIIANMISTMFTLFYLEIVIKVRKYITLKKENFGMDQILLSFSLPLVPNALGWWMMNVSDRYILNYYEGMAANGIYAIANKFPAMIIMVNSIFNLAWQESSIMEYNSLDRDQFFSKMFNQYMALQFTLTFIVLAFTRLFMSYWVNAHFGSAWRYVPFLYFGALFLSFSSFYGTGYLCAKETKGAFSSSAFGALLNIMLNLIGVPHIGIQGAGLSTMIAFLAMWVWRIIQTRKYFAIHIDIPKFLLLSTISIGMIGLYYTNVFYIRILTVLFSLVLFAIFNKNIIRKGFQLIKYRFA